MADTKPVIFKTYQTYGGYYVYDRHTNSVLTLSREEFEELQAVERGVLSPDVSSVIARYRQEGMFVPNVVKEIRHPQTDIMEHHAKRRLRQLILQVTQQCNLRCEYCAYSGIYEGNRVHSVNRMHFETAKRAIDFYLEHSIDSSSISISFYGGEPLLEFDLIRKCIDYVNETVEGKAVRFNLTTNGTLLTGERAKFLAEHSVSIAISLDGSKKEHDVCRKFPDGTGSFDVIIKNVQDLLREYPEYTQTSVMFFSTINPYMDLGCVMEYFSASEIIDERSVMYNIMADKDLKEEVNYQDSFYQIQKFEYMKALLVLAGKLDKKEVDPFARTFLEQAKKARRILHKRMELTPVVHPGGPCMPGILRLFVRYDGVLFPCERVNENLDFYRIGSVEDGFDLERMRDILNIGKLTEEECKSCWNLQRCSICSNEIAFHGKGKPGKKEKLELCREKKRESVGELYEQSVLKEFGYKTETEAVRR
ncbi:anaerobic sulfatase-maturating enzyme [Lachnospiraceae bacterium]|jgi:uncharacterized protein|nr:Cys-rich peptide radical SAM maturase CcpM [Eubacterium sp.]GFI26014.1 anaerobic sulfatase-maturating enzyme [Lachnospiraceae bacterium]